MRYFLNFFLQLVIVAGHAQTGHYFLSNHSPADKGIDQESFDMIQDRNGVLHFATQSGILTYDGKNWDVIPCGGAVYALEISNSGEVFWAGTNGFGKLTRTKSGFLTAELLSDSTYRNVYQLLAIADKVYFMNDDHVVVRDGDSNHLVKANEDLSGSFTSLFEIFNTAYVVANQGQCFQIDQLGLKEPGFNLRSEVTFSCGNGNQFLIGTVDNRLFLWSKDFSFQEVNIKDRDYLEASVITAGSWLDDDRLALATLRGGVIFLNLKYDSIEEIINYNTGLPDNEVFSLLVDRNKNVWVSHDYGFTCITPFAPFRSFSSYEKLNGNILCAAAVNNEIYVGTSMGLYKLSKEETYDEIVYYEDVPVKPSIEKTTPDPPILTSQQQAPEKSPKKKNGFLKFLRRKRNKDEERSKTFDEEVSTSGVTLDPKSVEPGQETSVERLQKTQRVLRSSQFIYKKVNGIEAKVNSLTIVNGQLKAAGIDGLFEIDDLSSKKILNKSIRFASVISDTIMVVSTYDDRVGVLADRKNGWQVTTELNGIEDQISCAFPGSHEELWLCGIGNVYRITLEAAPPEVSAYALGDKTFSKIVGLFLDGGPIFVNGNGFYTFERQKNLIVKIDSLPAPANYFATSGGLLYNDGHSWKALGEIAKSNIQMLGLCGDISFVAPDQRSKNLWIVNRDNEFYRFFGANHSLASHRFKVFFRKILQGGKTLKGINRLIVNQEEGPLEIEVAQSTFSGGSSLEYRFLLKGIDEKWSEWSSRNDHISFNYLPQGSYTLRVQSRDWLGKITEMESVQLQVQPPYWKTPWFYAMEFTIFALLVLLSFKLSVQYRFISRVLSLLTIILLIEFIQTIIGFTFFSNSGPVIEFLIQVVVALIILPVEGFLRNLMFKSMGSNSRLFEVIEEMNRKRDRKN